MIEFQVPGISCGHCAKAVTQAIQQVDPQARVEVNVATKQVRVDSQATGERLAQVLTGAGYPPQLVQA